MANRTTKSATRTKATKSQVAATAVETEKGDVLTENSGVKLLFTAIAKWNLSAQQWAETKHNWSRRCVLNGQLTNLNIALTKQAESIMSLEDWLGMELAYVSIQAVEIDDDIWFNARILPRKPNGLAILPLDKAIAGASEHAIHRVSKKSASKADLLTKAE